MNQLFFDKVWRAGRRRLAALAGRLRPLRPTLEAMASRPYELHLELTNLCNADCIFCPYQYQRRPTAFMDDEVFDKALEDFCAERGGSISFTPIVGDPLIAPAFLERVRAAHSRPEVDRIHAVTNGIRIDHFGAEALVGSGLTDLTLSIAGFDEAMYRRVYRSKQYPKVLRNVLALLEANRRAGSPLRVTVALRPDRPLDEVQAHPDFQRVMEYQPALDFTWAFTTAGGRITREGLPPSMTLRRMPRKPEACALLYGGPMVLADGRVLACSCVAAMDGEADLTVGNVLETPLGEIWRSAEVEVLRAGFTGGGLNATCRDCDMYRNLDLYRTAEGRERARLNRLRERGEVVRRAAEWGPFAGG